MQPRTHHARRQELQAQGQAANQAMFYSICRRPEGLYGEVGAFGQGSLYGEIWAPNQGKADLVL
jgi:hypothetical protein